jgi:hypothetical protein
MTLAKSLDIAIGLLLVFLVFSLVVSGITEAIAFFTKKRSKDLWAAIHRLVDEGTPPSDSRPIRNSSRESDRSSTQKLYDSSFVNEFQDRKNAVRTQISTLASSDFARGVIEVLVPNASGETSPVLTEAIASLPDGVPLKQALMTIAVEAENDLAEVRKDLEEWFDNQMERVSRLYRRWAKWVALVVGIVVAGVINVNVVYIAQTLNRDEATRSALVSSATNLVDTCTDKSDEALKTCLDENADRVKIFNSTIDLPIGWSDAPAFTWVVAVGWLLAALAFMQGAPFWFDVMKRAISLRGGTPP